LLYCTVPEEQTNVYVATLRGVACGCGQRWYGLSSGGERVGWWELKFIVWPLPACFLSVWWWPVLLLLMRRFRWWSCGWEICVL